MIKNKKNLEKARKWANKIFELEAKIIALAIDDIQQDKIIKRILNKKKWQKKN